ncbi:TolC family protein [Pedobacter sp. Hv1]|uniref:TolC family protein n=1 Tax=Pedobacter sp. Hv1 TaxID=1740090 RepID=UPI0006D8C987|nr:TolC family protein [Pedobacter sp. Hv1]KQC00024.1 hypothetical protein AQF98_16080 [Pedobacter sp. Hv1]
MQTIKLSAQSLTRNIDYFLGAATKYSPVLKDYKNQQQSIRIDSLLILAAAKPQVTASSAGMYAPIVKGYGYDEVLTNGQALEALLNVNYDLSNKRRVKNQLEGIKLQSDSIQYAGTLSLFDLKKSITDQYIIAYASQQQVEFNKEVTTLLKQEEALLKQLTRNNVYKQSEYLSFLVTLQQQQLSLKQAELQYQNDYAMLNYLAGLTDTTRISLAEPQLDHPISKAAKGFFAKRFDIDSLKNVNQKTAIDLNYRPKFGLYANSGYNSSFLLQPYKNFGASVGFTLSVPIYDGHQRKMQYEKLDLATLSSHYYKDFFIRQQQQQLDMILQQLAATDQLFVQLNQQIKFAKGLIEVNSKLLRTGDVKVVDYIIAINNYMAAVNLFRQTTTNRLKLINQFNYWNK